MNMLMTLPSETLTMQAKRRPYRVLIQRADRLGDVVLTLPVIDAIRMRFPEASISVLTSPIGAAFLEGHPHICEVLTYDCAQSMLSKAYWQLVSLIKEREFAVYISVWNHHQMAWLGFLAGIRYRIGDASNPSLRWLYHEKIHQHWEDRLSHQASFNLDLLSGLGIARFPIRRHIPVDAEAAREIAEERQKVLSPARRSVLIFCGTGGSNFPIPEAVLEPFILVLTKQANFSVVLCGQAELAPKLKALTGGHILNLLGKTTIKSMVAAIDSCDFYIGPDTGPTHIASFLNKPLLYFSSFKPSLPSRWGPMSAYFRIIRHEYICHHVRGQSCDPAHCFSFLTVVRLLREFQHMVEAYDQGVVFSEKQKRRILWQHSIRVVYVVRSSRDWLKIKDVIGRLRRQGLVIFPFYVTPFSLSSLFAFVRFVFRRNINVIQGSLPRFWLLCVTLWVGKIYQYIAPVYLDVPISRHVKAREYLALYAQLWYRQEAAV